MMQVLFVLQQLLTQDEESCIWPLAQSLLVLIVAPCTLLCLA